MTRVPRRRVLGLLAALGVAATSPILLAACGRKGDPLPVERDSQSGSSSSSEPIL